MNMEIQGIDMDKNSLFPQPTIRLKIGKLLRLSTEILELVNIATLLVEVEIQFIQFTITQVITIKNIVIKYSMREAEEEYFY